MILEMTLVFIFIVTPFLMFFVYKSEPIIQEFKSYEFQQIP